MADSRPPPGPFTRTATRRTPCSLARLAAVRLACCAANGVPFCEPRKPSEPALDHEIVRPSRSVNVTIVLLNDALTCTMPIGTFFLCARLKRFLVPFAFAIAYFFAFFLFAICPRRAPLRLRALVCVRCPRTGSPRR